MIEKFKEETLISEVVSAFPEGANIYWNISWISAEEKI